MGKKVLVSLEPLTVLSEESLRCLKENSSKCADCATILKYLVDGNRLSPAWRPDGTPFKYDDMKRHILEARGLALSPQVKRFVTQRAGTCREPDGVGCFYCARILEALTKDDRLQDWPQDMKEEQLKIPVEAQQAHLIVELGGTVEWEEDK